MKTCNKCGNNETVVDFVTPTYCRPCKNAYYRAYRKQPEPKRKHTKYQRDLTRLKEYGVTATQYDWMYRKQGGLCANSNCRSVGGKRGLVVDHDHDTGLVRGLLCDKCNRGMGFFNDNVDMLIAGAEYLERHAIQRITSPFE